MPGIRIAGTGSYLPGEPYTNAQLAHVMDTNDAWIRQRTGIAQRHYAPEGSGAADLALHAATRALEATRRDRLSGKALATALGFRPHYLLVCLTQPRDSHCYKVCTAVLPRA